MFNSNRYDSMWIKNHDNFLAKSRLYFFINVFDDLFLSSSQFKIQWLFQIQNLFLFSSKIIKLWLASQKLLLLYMLKKLKKKSNWQFLYTENPK